MSTKLSANFSNSVSIISTFILGLSSLSLLPVFNSISVHAAGRLIINEFVPAPSSRSCSSFGNQETVELFNSGDAAIDYTTFFLRDKSGIQKNLTSGVTIRNSVGGIVSGNLVPIGGYLVFRTSEGWLNNTTQGGTTPTDGVYLYDNGTLVDSQDYNITDGMMSDLVFRNNGGSFSSSFQSSFGRSNSGIQDLNCSSQSSSSSSLISSSRSSNMSSSLSNSSTSSSNTSNSRNSSLISSSNSSSLPPSSSSSLQSSLSSSNTTSRSLSSVSVNSSTNSSIISSNSYSSIGQFGNLKVCKEDNLANKLSNWEFNLKNTGLNQNLINLTQKTQTSGTSSVVQTLSIDTKNSGLTPSMDLPAGNYSIKVSGKYVYGSFGGKSIEADGAYSFRPIGAAGGTDGWVSGDNLPSPFTGMLKVRANNQNLNFGSYNPTGVYTTQISKGNGPINFSINDTAYQDNAGSLQIEITRIAETNGCTTFFNLPYGSYNLTETMQPNWNFVKVGGETEKTDIKNGTGLIGVEKLDRSIVFVNKFTAPITSGGGVGGPIYYGGGNNGNGGSGGNILAPVTTTSQNNSQNNTNSTKSTAVKGVEDNEKDIKISSKSSKNTNNSNSQNNSQGNVTNSLSNIEYRIRLVENSKTPIETKVVSGNNSLIRTGGSENLELISGLMLILMGTGLYFSFKQKNLNKSTKEQL